MIASVRKQQIKAEGNEGEARFAAMQLIDDPQGFAEMLFKKLKEGAQAFETKMLLLQVVSRVVGLHQLILLNFYPFLQRYIQPNQRDVRLYFLLVFKTFFFPCILCLVRVLEAS
jgi:protein SDA1